jgi:hypothetical protein
MLMSYHKSLNPVEVAVAVRDGFLVQYKDFPKFFIGINFGKSWGEAKDDVSELPMLLIEQLKKEYEEGLHHKPVLEDHIEYMQRLKKDYIVNRIKYILLEINGGNPSIWTIEQVSQRFTNYTVRAYLQDIVKGTYTISDFEDPVEVLLSKLSAFISQYMLDKDQTAVVTCRKRKRIINTKTWKETYDNESSFMENRKGKAIIAENVDVNQDSTESEDDEIYLGYDFLHEDEGIAEDTGGIVRFEDTVESWDTGFFKEYLTPMRNGELMSLDSATIKSTEKPYKNFTVVNKRVTIKLPSTVKFSEIYKIIQGKQSTSANAIDTYVLLNHLQIKPLGAYKVEILREIDEYLSNVN